jgi:SAM-dependent methyltransferase
MTHQWGDFYLAYSEQESDLQSRLSIIRQYIKKELNRNTKNVLSICGGRGLDLVDLTELQDAYIIDNDEPAMDHVSNNIKFLLRDAELSNSYLDIPKADLIICVGFLSSIEPESIEDFISFLPQILNKGAILIWSAKYKNVEEIEYLLEKYKFHYIEKKNTDLNRFVCAKHRFYGESQQIIPNKKIMNMSW